MLSRLRYIFRETFDSFRRNATLTMAAIITAAISLLGVGLTLLSQQGFDNLLSKWEGGVEMIIFVNAGATADQLGVIDTALGNAGTFVQDFTYCDAPCSLGEAQIVLAGEPGTLALLGLNNIPTQYKVVPTEGTDVELLRQLEGAFAELPNVFNVQFAEDQPDWSAPRLLRVPALAVIYLPAVGGDPVDLEHGSYGDLCPTTGNRGDETGRCD